MSLEKSIKKLTLYYLMSSAEMGEDYHDSFFDAEQEGAEAAFEFLENNKKSYCPLLDYIATLERYVEAVRDKTEEEMEALGLPISELDFSVTTYNWLMRLNILTVYDLTQKSEQDLLGERKYQPKYLSEIKRELSKLNLALRLDEN